MDSVKHQTKPFLVTRDQSRN